MAYDKKNNNRQQGQSTGTAVVEFKPSEVRDLLDKSRDKMAAAAARMINPERLVAVAMTSIQRTPLLLKCSKMSLAGAVIQCGSLGLYPDSILGHAYLVPFYNGKKGCYEAQLIPGYKGLMLLARRSGELIDLHTAIVYDKEPFEFTAGENRTLKHTPLPPDKRGKEKIAVYCVATLKSGVKHIEVMWAEQVLKIKARATAGKEKFSPWIDKNHPEDEDEMWKKTIIRYTAKYLPLSPELQEASSYLEHADAGRNTRTFFEDDEVIYPELEGPGGPSALNPAEDTEKGANLFWSFMAAKGYDVNTPGFVPFLTEGASQAKQTLNAYLSAWAANMEVSANEAETLITAFKAIGKGDQPIPKEEKPT